MTKARDLANIISGGFTEADIPNLSAGKITSGTFADARLSQSSVQQYASTFDDNKIVNDISTLGLRVHTQENLNASNTNSASFDVFQDSSGIASNTNAPRNVAGEYVAPVSGITPSISGAGNSANPNPSFSFNSTTGLITLDNSSVAYQGGNPDNNGVYWSIIDFGQDVTFDSGLMVELLTGVNNAGNVNAGLCQLNIKNNSNAWVFGSGGITPTVTENFVAAGGTISAVNDIYNQDLDYQGIYAGVNSLPVRASLSWSGTATGRYLYTAWSNTWGEPSTYKLYDNSNGSSGNGNNLLIAGAKSIANATGSFESVAITTSSTSSMGAVITYQDYSGTNALNTDIILKLSADNGSNYSTATLTALPNFATGIKMAKVNDLSVTAGTSLKYKISFANQSSGSKEARIRGVSLQY